MTAVEHRTPAPQAAALVYDGFASYRRAFEAVTGRAAHRFTARDWRGMQADARERLELYGHVLGQVLGDLERMLGAAWRDEGAWASIRTTYADRIAGHPAGELAETFFNSVTRQVFATVGVNPAIEFVDFRFGRAPVLLDVPPLDTFVRHGSTAETIARVLAACPIEAPWRDSDADAARVARIVDRQWDAGGAPLPYEEIEVLKPVFYRRKGAYVLGRVRSGERIMPLALALVHGDDGVAVDAALTTEDEVSVVFSFTRSYFHVTARRPADLITFLRSVLPLKPVGELYTALGHHKHGKTEFWRDLQRHLARSDERFVRAPGAPGMVMAVFTLPSLDVVFKVIRATFPPEKRTTADEVRQRYRFVFRHDRAGRLVEAQEFEHVAFDRDRFSAELLDELLRTAGRAVRVEGDRVVIGRVYTERRVRPLDLYLRTASASRIRRAVLEYGLAIRELAATNVFPGDFLPKNFGVTRHGRVVFYDYDELATLEDCTFRPLPPAAAPEDELARDPWFSIGPRDVFPEELARFVPFRGPLRQLFLEAHGDLFTPGFWRAAAARAAVGDLPDIFPYREEARVG